MRNDFYRIWKCPAIIFIHIEQSNEQIKQAQVNYGPVFERANGGEWEKRSLMANEVETLHPAKSNPSGSCQSPAYRTYLGFTPGRPLPPGGGGD